jgi:hypothetical protein
VVRNHDSIGITRLLCRWALVSQHGVRGVPEGVDGVGEFRLEAHDFRDLTRWRWALTGPGGALIADHEVRLDAGSWQFEAFGDLLGYLQWNVAPDRRAVDEARILAEVGQWIGGQVLGPVAEAMVRARPATVRVTVQAGLSEAQSLLFRPLELACIGGRPLSVQGVTLVMQPGPGDTVPAVAPVGERLRVLGLFSLPEGGQPLNLRRERHALVKLLARIAGRGRAAQVRVLQYGVTRDRLRDALEEDEGWDVIHISGHGAPGELLLETAAGRPDRMTAADIVGLLDLARERVKLVTLSACWSAALTAADQRRLLGLAVPGDAAGRTAGGDGGFALGSLAAELAKGLGCAVLAMRYPVADDFAITLADKLYGLLADKGRPLPRALGIALSEMAAEAPSKAWPALSAGTPGLFGARAVDLRLAAPPREGAESYDTGALKMAGFPPQQDRFVGRTGVMARGSAALADASAVPGVLLHGMPGSGKTACALELAYTHEHSFDRLVWFKAPDEGRDITTALTDFAITLERELPGFQMVHVLADDDRLQVFLPRLTELAERRRVLIVIDNAESLLSESGEWRDARWGQVVGALCAHAGLGRVVLTTRQLPASATGLQVEAVDALSLDEALLLTRELPHLRDLIDGGAPGVEPDTARMLARGLLNIAQGHPKLLELADGQAANPTRLGALIAVGDQAWRQTGGVPVGFFATGESQAAGTDYLHVLAAWTDTVTDGLGPGQRALFWFLCCLEEDDRVSPVAKDNWARLWTRLQLGGRPPQLEDPLAALTGLGLVTVQHRAGAAHQRYGIHPVIAAAGRAASGKLPQVVDRLLGVYWSKAIESGLGREGESPATSFVVRAALAAIPYAMRLGEWTSAASMIDLVVNRDGSRQTAATVLPAIQAIAATGEPGASGVLAKVLLAIDPAAGERHMRAFLNAALAEDDFRAAGAAAGYLGASCLANGQLPEALALADAAADYTKRAGLGPWTRLMAEVERLRVLSEMGQAQHVFTEVQRLSRHMLTLPRPSDQPEATIPWSVREELLDRGRESAMQLSRWNDAIEFTAACVASKRDRGALPAEIARAAANDYGPLIKLGRHEQAMVLLRECRKTFEDAHDIKDLGKTFSSMAHVEWVRNHSEVAVSLQRDALRYNYLAGDVRDIATSYVNLGSFLLRGTHERTAGLACHIAAGLILSLAGADTGELLRAVSSDLRELGNDATVPADIANLCRLVGENGTELERLLVALAPAPQAAQQALRALTTRISELAATSPAAGPGWLAGWDPAISALLAAASGDSQADAALDQQFARYQDSVDWGGLVAALRRLRSGETGPELLAGLDENCAAIITRALDARAGKISIPPALWPAMELGPLLTDVLDAARVGDTTGGRARPELEAMAAQPLKAPLAAVLTQILGGDRNPSLTAQLSDPTQKAAVMTVLEHLGTDQRAARD